MADVSVDVDHKEEELSDGERKSERDLGHAEAEIEHQEEQLEEHADEITNLKADKEWIQSELAAIRSELANAASMPVSVVEELRSQVASLAEKLEEISTRNLAAPVTQPPIQKEEHQEEKESSHLVNVLI